MREGHVRGSTVGKEFALSTPQLTWDCSSASWIVILVPPEVSPEWGPKQANKKQKERKWSHVGIFIATTLFLPESAFFAPLNQLIITLKTTYGSPHYLKEWLFPKDKTVSVRERGKSWTQLVGMWMSLGFMGSSMEIPPKSENRNSTQSTYPIFRYLPLPNAKEIVVPLCFLIWRNICTPVFIAALFIVSEDLKAIWVPIREDGLKVIWPVHTMRLSNDLLHNGMLSAEQRVKSCHLPTTKMASRLSCWVRKVQCPNEAFQASRWQMEKTVGCTRWSKK